MKKIIQLVGSIALLLSMAACGNTNTTSDTDKLQVATTSYALKYFIEAVGGNDVEVVYALTDNPHHFELSQADAQQIAKADIFFNVEIGDYLSIGTKIKNVNKEMTTVDVATGIELLSYVGHFHEHDDDDHSHAHDDHNHDHDAASEEIDDALREAYDPHIWLDPIKAKKLVSNIAEGLLSFENVDATSVNENVATLHNKLADLDEKLHTGLASLTTPYLVVSHAAYGYLADHYHFEQKAVNDASDHSENTQTSMIEMDDFIADKNIKYIFVETNVESNSAIDVLVQKHNLEILAIYNLETAVDTSADYFELMEINLTNLKKAMV